MRFQKPGVRACIAGGAVVTLTALSALAYVHFSKVPEPRIPARDSGLGFVTEGAPHTLPDARGERDFYCTLDGGERIYGRFVSVIRGQKPDIVGLNIDAYDAADAFAFSAKVRVVTPAIAAEYQEWRAVALEGSQAPMGTAIITNAARLKGGAAPDSRLAARALQAFLYSEALVGAARLHGGQAGLSINQGNLHEMRLKLASSHLIPVQGARCKPV